MGVAVFVGVGFCFCLAVVVCFLAPATESWLGGFYCKPFRAVMFRVGL